MGTTTAVRWLTAGACTVAALAAGTPAQAAGVETYLLTRPAGGNAALNQIGAGGVAAGLWTSYRLRGGIAGSDLLVTHQRRTTLRPAPVLVYTAPPGPECTEVGNRGTAAKVWLSFTCQIGFAGNDLRVR
jgi:hypothetical protein